MPPVAQERQLVRILLLTHSNVQYHSSKLLLSVMEVLSHDLFSPQIICMIVAPHHRFPFVFFRLLAFAVPLLAKIDEKSRKTQALVIVPSRELAEQTGKVRPHSGEGAEHERKPKQYELGAERREEGKKRRWHARIFLIFFSFFFLKKNR